MNLLKIIVRNCLLLSFFALYTQENPTTETSQQTPDATSSQTQTTEATPPNPEEKKDETPVATETKSEETKPEENKPTETKPEESKAPEEQNKEDMTNWKNHLQTLLVAGAHWDSADNIPDKTWQDEAINLATLALKKDISLADELKSSFFDTVQDKYTNIEKSTNLKSFFETIESFNTKITEIVKELGPKEETPTANGNVAGTDKAATEANVKSEENATPEEKVAQPSEEKKEETPEEVAEKEKAKKQATWKECLEKIQKEGITEDEVKNILEQATSAAKELLLSTTDPATQKDHADILENEFEQAVKQRSADITLDVTLTPITEDQINAFKNDITAIFKENESMPTTQEPQPIMPQQQSFVPEINRLPPVEQTKPGQKKEQPQPQAAPATKPTTVATEPPKQQTAAPTIVVVTQPTQQAPVATTKEQEKSAMVTENQQLLAQQIKKAAVKKALIEKQESQKGIISSIMGAVLGEWWTGPSATEKTLKEIKGEQDKLIDQMIQNKFKPSDKDLIKNAYHTFQEKLLSFNVSKVWDKDKDEPKSEELSKWVKKIESSLKVLLKFEVMDIESITTVLKETLENSKISAKGYKNIVEDRLIPDLQKYTIDLKKERAEEAARLQQEEAERKQREQQRAQLQEQEKSVELRQQEEEKQATLQQKDKEKTDAIKLLKKAEEEWPTLMEQITTSKPAGDESNKAFTQKALELTLNVLKSPIFPEKNKKEIKEKHIAEFTKAMLAQQKYNDEHVNVHHYIEYYLKEVNKNL